MSPDLQILPARDQDLPAISALAGVIWRQCYPAILTAAQIDYMLGWMYDVATMRREMREEGITYERLLAGETLIGFAAWGPAPDGDELPSNMPSGAPAPLGMPPVAKLHKIYLLPDHHGQGRGSRLLNHVIAAASAQGYSTLLLNVNKRNTQAIKAYERNGFRITQSVCNDIGRGYVMDDYVMSRPL